MNDEETNDAPADDEQHCPNCLIELFTRNVETGERAQAEDLCVCRNCGLLIEMDENGKPQRASPATMEELSTEEPVVYRKMMAVRKRILRSIEKRAKPVVN